MQGYGTTVYKIIFDIDGIEYEHKYVEPPHTNIGTLPIAPVRSGYNFGGWYTEPLGAGIRFTATTAVTSNLTVYANWESYSYTVTFNSMNGTPPILMTVNSPDTTVSSLPDKPKKDLHVFDGWYTGENGTGTQFTASTIVTGNITIYAKWIGFFDYTISNNKITIIGLTEYGKKNLTTDLVIPSELNGLPVIGIGDSAFREHTCYTGTLTIPDSVTSIGNYAFMSCSGFTGNLVIPNSVTSIGEYAFFRCSGFTGNLVIPNSITTIGYRSFLGCNGFNGNLVISNNVTSIGDEAFCGCEKFTGQLTIPALVTSIGYRAFEGCLNFSGSLVIPDNVVIIGEEAFAGCYGFEGSLVIGNKVKTIGNSAFYGCAGLTGGFTEPLTIPDSVTSIGRFAFELCKGFTNVIIGTGVTNIGDGAFIRCKEIKNVKVTRLQPSILGSNVFYNSGLNTIQVPSSALGDYKEANGWSVYADLISGY